jgi:hypothetical protein
VLAEDDVGAGEVEARVGASEVAGCYFRGDQMSPENQKVGAAGRSIEQSP